MKLTWYFDFISPFAYLQHAKFSQLPANVSVEYCPVLLAGLLNHWQNIGPAEVPPKRIFTYKHCYWLAKKTNIPFKMPPAHPFNSLNALRIAIATGCQPSSIQCLFDVIWKYGLALESDEAITMLQKELGHNDLSKLTGNPQVKNQLRINTERAANEGVFGVPSFVTQDKNAQLFWGLDAFDMMLDYLQSPTEFYNLEMQRIESLPVGVQRRRD